MSMEMAQQKLEARVSVVLAPPCAPAEVHQPAHLLAPKPELAEPSLEMSSETSSIISKEERAMNWKEREAAAERAASPMEPPPPAYRVAPVPPHARTRSIPAMAMLTHFRSSSLHNMKHAAFHHFRSASLQAGHLCLPSSPPSVCSSFEPEISQDKRVWYRKKRNTLLPASAFLLVVLIFLVIIFAYIIPRH